MTLCQLTALKEWRTPNLKYQRTPTPRPLPNSVSKEAWQVQRDEQFKRGSGIGKPVANEEKFKIDLRVQGVPQKAVLEDEDRTRKIRKLAHTLESQSREKALITDLPKTDTFNPFSEQSNTICTTRVMSSSVNNAKSVQKRDAHRVCNIDQTESCIASVDNAWKSKDE